MNPDRFKDTNEQLKGHRAFAEHYYRIARQNLPVMNRAVQHFGEHTLADYLREFTYSPTTAYQSCDDLCDIIKAQTTPLLGEHAARRIAQALASQGIALTANHHAVDSFSLTFQGTLLFILKNYIEAAATPTIPVFSFANVPLNNLMYPKGLLIYNVCNTGVDAIPHKLSFFPDRLKRRMVSATPPLDHDMIGCVENHIRNGAQNRLAPKAVNALGAILQEYHRAASVEAASSYSQQCTIINNRIWKQIFAVSGYTPEVVYLEIEKVAADLLANDLTNPRSLAACVMFDPELRKRILDTLDNARACWQLSYLKNRLGMSPNQIRAGGGTIFFWGIDDRGRRVPLYLTRDGSNRDILAGIDDGGNSWQYAFTPRAIVNGMQENKLLPSLFSCFLVVAFARGINCIGGFFQGDYLPHMQRCIVTALGQTHGYERVARFVEQVPTDGYLIGMIAVMSAMGAGKSLVPAGPVEIISGGGLTCKDVEQILALTVREAHFAGLFDIVVESLPSDLARPGWKERLALGCTQLLDGKVVVK